MRDRLTAISRRAILRSVRTGDGSARRLFFFPLSSFSIFSFIGSGNLDFVFFQSWTLENESFYFLPRVRLHMMGRKLYIIGVSPLISYLNKTGSLLHPYNQKCLEDKLICLFKNFPEDLRWVLECKLNDAGGDATDEIGKFALFVFSSIRNNGFHSLIIY